MFLLRPVAQLAVNPHQGLTFLREGKCPKQAVGDNTDQVRGQSGRKRCGLILGEDGQGASRRALIGADRTGQGWDGIAEGDRPQPEQGQSKRACGKNANSRRKS